MVKQLNALFCFFTLSISAQAVEWLDLGKTYNGNLQTFIDLDSIGNYKMRGYTDRNYKSAFVQFTYINNHEYRKEGLYYSKDFVVVDCDKKTLGKVASIRYGFKNQVLDSEEKNHFSDSDLNIVFPETTGQTILKKICYNKN